MKREPQIRDFCDVNYDGRLCVATVTEVNKSDKTFNVTTSFEKQILNIPFDLFRYSPNLGNLIVNTIELKYSLNLKTVEALQMTDDINELIKEKSWMVRFL